MVFKTVPAIRITRDAGPPKTATGHDSAAMNWTDVVSLVIKLSYHVSIMFVGNWSGAPAKAAMDRVSVTAVPVVPSSVTHEEAQLPCSRVAVRGPVGGACDISCVYAVR